MIKENIYNESNLSYEDLLKLANGYAKGGDYENSQKVVEIILSKYPEKRFNSKGQTQDENRETDKSYL